MYNQTIKAFNCLTPLCAYPNGRGWAIYRMPIRYYILGNNKLELKFMFPNAGTDSRVRRMKQFGHFGNGHERGPQIFRGRA